MAPRTVWACQPGNAITSATVAPSGRRIIESCSETRAFIPATIVTDKLDSYGAGFRELGLRCPHEQGLRMNNRTENSHRVVRRRERKMQRFKSMGSAQRLRGPNGARDEFHLAATAQNLRKLAMLLPLPAPASAT